MTYPFSALVGSDDLRTALLLGAVDPSLGGVLVRGEKGTAKSTAVRALTGLLPDVAVVAGCRFSCDPAAADPACPDGPHDADAPGETRPTRMVELPVGASEERVTGALDLERALAEGVRAFEPGLLAAAHRGVLYIDEVNLLGDHVVDLLLDAAAMGTARVEREGVAVAHAARFQLVGSMNPEEGELRPQLLDRFGLTVEVRASREPEQRAEVVRRRLAYEADPDGFARRFADDDARVAARLRAARARLGDVALGPKALDAVVAACTAFEVDGLRADLVTAKAATALAAWHGRDAVTVDDVREAARLALPHRRRRGPLEAPGIDEDALDEALDGCEDDEPPGGPPDGDGGPPGSGEAGGGQDGGEGAPGDDGRGAPAAQGASGQGGPGDGEGVPPQGAADDAPGGDGHAGEQPAGQEPAGQGPAGEEPAGEGARQAGEDGQPAGGAAPARSLPAGEAFAPVLLAVDGLGRGAAGRRSPAEGPHGAAVAARRPDDPRRPGELALAATVRAAAPAQAARGRRGAGLELRAEDLRATVRAGRERNLVLFCVDASGSMAARQRMTAVKGAVVSLLLDAYRRRDRVGVVTFRGDDAELAVPPTGAVDVAAERLAELPTGGRTPLAAGLDRAAATLASEAVRDRDRRPLLVVLTDGRATRARRDGADPVDDAVGAAAGLAARAVPAIVVDTEEGRARLGLAQRLGDALGAATVRLEQLHGEALAGVVRAAAPTTQRRAA